MGLTSIPGFIDGSYDSRARGVSACRSVNLRIEKNKPGSKTAFTAYPRWGKKLFTTIPTSPNIGMWANKNRAFAVAGGFAYELKEDGSTTLIGAVTPSGNPATMRANKSQLLICSGGDVFIATGTVLYQPIVNFANGIVSVDADGITVHWLSGDKFTVGDPASDIVAGNVIMIGTERHEALNVASDILLTLTAPVSGGIAIPQIDYQAGSGTTSNPTCLLKGATCAFVDGYFIVNTPNSKEFRISNFENGKQWDALDVQEKNGSTDNIARVMELSTQLALIGDTNSVEVWTDSGNADFPFERLGGRSMNCGADAAWSVAKLVDGSLCWLMYSEQGSGEVVQTTGGEPVRISDHAFENAVLGYTKTFDAVASSYLVGGHSIYRIDFPTANRAWEFDRTTGVITELGIATDQDEVYAADVGRFYCYVTWPSGAKMALQADYTSGKIYQVSEDFIDDDGVEFPLLRIGPSINVGLTRVGCSQFALDCELGTVDPSLVGPDGKALIPTITLAYSDDGANTWTDAGAASLGRTGEYQGTYLTPDEQTDVTPGSQTNPQTFEMLPRWYGLGDSFIAKTFKVKSTSHQLRAMYDGLVEFTK